MLLLGRGAYGAQLQALPEFLRPDPFGGIVTADRGQSNLLGSVYDRHHAVALEGGRGGYVSFQLVVSSAKPAGYTLSVRFTGPVQADLFREWFHYTLPQKTYYPDALVPVQSPYRAQLPDLDNHIANQTARAFWVDLWIPPDAAPGIYSGSATLEVSGKRSSLPIKLKVIAAVIPKDDVITVDHNSYGSSWIADEFPRVTGRTGGDFFKSDEFFDLIHAYHRIFYEHRGILHQLGYGHAGKVSPEFAPALEGSGRNKHISSWELFDRHYGPLLDGTAFAGTRRGPRPIPFMYLPINPEWPASFLWWGEPGYETEFVNVVSEMERHFREKGWTKTHFEVFFNHKKRYKGFAWDGDEVKFPKDVAYFVKYGELLKKALPPDTPVHFVFRADVSWDMEQQFKVLQDIVRMWICNGAILSWYQGVPKMLRDRGDIAWYYGGPPSVTEVSSRIAQSAFQAWLWDTTGFVHWLAVSPGDDPWFHFDGGGTTLVYSGERFGIEEPIPSIRLKLERNCLQDLALLDSLKRRRPLDELKAEAAKRFNGSTPDEWWNPRPAFADLPSDQWTGADIDDAVKHTEQLHSHLNPNAWANVRQFTLDLASEAK